MKQTILPPLSDRPLVTFALFTYNQENYIREALEGAFSQSYEPLEIIVSDDCSTDSTYKVIESIKQNYFGSKKLVVRQTKSNCGTLRHVAEVAKLAKGKLLVLAAGDDISKPNRTEALVSYWLETGSWGIYSNFDLINDSGSVIGVDLEMDQFSPPMNRLREYFLNDTPAVEFCHGATSAYDLRLFKSLPETKEHYILSEDGALSFLITLLGEKISRTKESLVLYRTTENSLTNGSKLRHSFLELKYDEFCIERLARSQANRCTFLLELNNLTRRDGFEQLNTDLINQDFDRLEARAGWSAAKIAERMDLIFSNKLMFEDLKWALPRLLSIKAFILMKLAFRKLSYLTSGRVLIKS